MFANCRELVLLSGTALPAKYDSAPVFGLPNLISHLCAKTTEITVVTVTSSLTRHSHILMLPNTGVVCLNGMMQLVIPKMTDKLRLLFIRNKYNSSVTVFQSEYMQYR